MKHWPWKDNTLGSGWRQTAAPTQHQTLLDSLPHTYGGSGTAIAPARVWCWKDLSVLATTAKWMYHKRKEVMKEETRLKSEAGGQDKRGPESLQGSCTNPQHHHHHPQRALAVYNFYQQRTFSFTLDMRLNMNNFSSKTAVRLKYLWKPKCTKSFTYPQCSRYLVLEAFFSVFLLGKYEIIYVTSTFTILHNEDIQKLGFTEGLAGGLCSWRHYKAEGWYATTYSSQPYWLMWTTYSCLATNLWIWHSRKKSPQGHWHTLPAAVQLGPDSARISTNLINN